jgi:hypothetical protein
MGKMAQAAGFSIIPFTRLSAFFRYRIVLQSLHKAFSTVFRHEEASGF